MRRIVPALVLVLVLAATGLAARLSEQYTALADGLAARLAAIPATGLTKDQKKQKAVLVKATAAMTHDATSADRLLANAGKVVAALDKPFAADADLGMLLDGMIADVASDTNGRLVDLRTGTSLLPDGKAKTRISRQIAVADRALVGSTTAATRPARTKLLRTASAAITLGEAALVKAGGGNGGAVTTTELDFQVGADAGHLPSPEPLASWTTGYAANGAGVFTMMVSFAPAGTASHNFSLFATAPGVGQRNLTTVGSSYGSIPGPQNVPLTGGTITFSVWDPAGRKCKGTFTATFSNGPTTVTVTGSFSTTNLLVP